MGVLGQLLSHLPMGFDPYKQPLICAAFGIHANPAENQCLAIFLSGLAIY